MPQSPFTTVSAASSHPLCVGLFAQLCVRRVLPLSGRPQRARLLCAAPPRREGQKAELQRDDAGTWKGWGVDLRGIVSGSLAQGAGAWNVRGLPMVKGAFAQIWEDDDLIVSMDCALVWRPWVGPSTWKGSGAMNTGRG